MKYQGKELRQTPTLELIKSYISLHPSLIVTPEDVMQYWGDKGWITNQGTEVKTLEAAIDVCNGVFVSRFGKKKKLSKRKKREEAKKFKQYAPLVIEVQKTRERTNIIPSLNGRKILELIGREVDSNKVDRKLNGNDLQDLCNEEYRKSHQSDCSMTYSEQLKDLRWLAFRKCVLSIRGARCELCGNTKTLQIHHPVYINGRKAWEYTCNEVVVLCRDCHKAVHNKQ